MRIDRLKFLSLHQAFLEHVVAESGEPFHGFDNPWLIDEEIAYKYEAIRRGRAALKLDRWQAWRKRPGRILGALKEACQPSSSQNLLYWRHGRDKSSASALYRVKPGKAVADLESALFDFLKGGPPEPESLGPRFDRFATYLTDQSLGCSWRFVAYLAFLLRPQVYFPVLPTKFDSLLEYFEKPTRLTLKVSWERYEGLLDLGRALADELGEYGRPNAIEIQSYMYVVASLGDRAAQHSESPPFDPLAELKKRQTKALERERIGLAGERIVYEAEQERLRATGRNDLAERVQLVSVDGGTSGYDVLSFSLDEKELHIEVKSTDRLKTNDAGFWITEHERAIAKNDPCWTLVRVWNVSIDPEREDLGNIVRSPNAGWHMDPSSWFVERIDPAT